MVVVQQFDTNIERLNKLNRQNINKTQKNKNFKKKSFYRYIVTKISIIHIETQHYLLYYLRVIMATNTEKSEFFC